MTCQGCSGEGACLGDICGKGICGKAAGVVLESLLMPAALGADQAPPARAFRCSEPGMPCAMCSFDHGWAA